MSKFQQRHYEFIAETIQEMRRLEFGHEQCDYVTRVFADRLAQENPKFKPDLFKKASGWRSGH